MYRVRPINDERVKEMTRLFVEKKQTSLTSYLMVLEQHGDDGTKYVVVDGNHRLRGFQYIRDDEGKVERFKALSCRVYTKLSSVQELSLGFTKNREASDVYKMTDYDMVVNLQKIIQQLKKREEETIYLTVYELLNATSVGPHDDYYV